MTARDVRQLSERVDPSSPKDCDEIPYWAQELRETRRHLKQALEIIAACLEAQENEWDHLWKGDSEVSTSETWGGPDELLKTQMAGMIGVPLQATPFDEALDTKPAQPEKGEA